VISSGFPHLSEAAVIGAGPSGAAAAVQLKRYGIDPLVFEKDRVGGLLCNANHVENYPGFPGGISGPELVERIQRQLKQVGVEVLNEKVIELDYKEGCFFIQTSVESWYAKRVVLATGTKPCPVDIPISTGAAARVFSEVYPLLDKKGLQVLVVGSGDAAFDYALNLAGRGCQVVILNRGENLKCLPLLWERAAACPSIRYQPGIQILSIRQGEGGDKLESVCRSSEGRLELESDYVLFATGREPAVELLSAPLQAKSQELREAGLLYLIGDVNNGIYRQTAIAAGDGLRAAMQICRLVEQPLVRVPCLSWRPR
jgi:thioredoxin reductase (NADPH)